jgi:hypothetical protein
MVVVNEMQLKLAMLETVLKPLIRKLAKKISARLQHYINDKWYNSPETEYYDRTYDFLTSIVESEVKMRNNDFSMEIYIDYEKMWQTPPSSGKFGSRTSLDSSTDFRGKPISYWLIQWIEEGQNSPVHSYKGINMFGNVSEELEKQLDSYIISCFNEMGISYVRG